MKKQNIYLHTFPIQKNLDPITKSIYTDANKYIRYILDDYSSISDEACFTKTERHDFSVSKNRGQVLISFIFMTPNMEDIKKMEKIHTDFQNKNDGSYFTLHTGASYLYEEAQKNPDFIIGYDYPPDQEDLWIGLHDDDDYAPNTLLKKYGLKRGLKYNSIYYSGRYDRLSFYRQKQLDFILQD